jgi:hypothetical protein
MLSIYPQTVLERATSPSRGLPATVAYPNLAKFKEKLDEWHGEHQDDLRRRGLLKPRGETPRRVEPQLLAGPDAPAGCFANLHVPSDHPRYAATCERAKTEDHRCWKFGKSSVGKDGIWITTAMWEEGKSGMRRVAPIMTPDQLRAHYAPRRQADEDAA